MTPALGRQGPQSCQIPIALRPRPRDVAEGLARGCARCPARRRPFRPEKVGVTPAPLSRSVDTLPCGGRFDDWGVGGDPFRGGRALRVSRQATLIRGAHDARTERTTRLWCLYAVPVFCRLGSCHDWQGSVRYEVSGVTLRITHKSSQNCVQRRH